MARYRTEVTTSADPTTAFDWMADFTNAQIWDPGVKEVRRIDAGPVTEGASFDVDVAFAGTTTTMRYDVSEHKAPDKVVLRATTPLLTSVDTITVRPAGDGSVVTYEAVLKLRGPLGLADPLLALAFQRIGDKAAEGLRVHLRRLGAATTNR